MRKKSNFGSMIGMLLFIGIIAGGVFVYTSPMFEQDKPSAVLIDSNGFWNMKKPLMIKIDDESGLKQYKVTLKSGDKSFELASEQFMTPETDTVITVDVPKNVFRLKVDEVVITVEANDASSWNFMKGNSSKDDFLLIVDKRRPVANVITNSYGIRKGGSALVVFEASDDNIKSFHIETDSGKHFVGQPFYKENVYVALIAWPVMEESFRARLVVEDEAGNVARAPIPFYIKSAQYRTRTLKLSDKYLEGKIAQLAEDYAETQDVEGRIPQFKVINEDVREANEKLIHEITATVPDTMISSFSVTPMYPLKNAQILGGFGDHRYYHYHGEQVSEAYHLGLDMASVKQAKITPQNGGEVVYAGYNGIYGNMPVIHHGMGLYTLYAHCSSMNVQVGDVVKPKQVIANTGTTGSVLGDHLHFGVLVQGVDVRPQEWMDKQWIRLNITEVLNNAKKIMKRS
ncbi:MAG: M23 family metallopeptidase [Campylobacterota bacterium]|nr:M23 family metallopeptidase [Campylobacterota bacterium]